MTTQLNERQRELLRQVVRASDGDSPELRSGAATERGLCARGPTVAALKRRGLVRCAGYVAEVDGDGFTVREDAPLYVVTDAGRALVHDVAAATRAGGG